jgi:alkylation response protein AidB-like acyl-CoA dehydrogenase
MDAFASLAKPHIVAVADEAARRIAERVARDSERGEDLLAGAVDDLRATGYLTLTIPESLGGLGGDVLDACAAQERIARALGSAGLAANMHISYVAQSQVSGLWPRPMIEAFMRGVVRDGYFINNCQAEAEMGSPARGGLPATRADRVDGGWRVTGRKQWSTGSTFLTHFAVSATVNAPDMPQHLGQFLVAHRSPGVRVEPTWDALAMRESASHDIVFEDVFVPDADVIRVSPAGEPFRPPVDVAPWHGLSIAATYTGVAVAARDWVARFAATRVPTNLGKPIGEIPGVRQRVGEIEALLLASRRLIYGVARDWVEGRGERSELAAQVGLVKYHATNNAVRVTDLAMRIAGGFGLMRAEPLERCFRDVRAGLIHPPLDDVALDGAAKRALGEFSERAEPA